MEVVWSSLNVSAVLAINTNGERLRIKKQSGLFSQTCLFCSIELES